MITACDSMADMQESYPVFSQRRKESLQVLGRVTRDKENKDDILLWPRNSIEVEEGSENTEEMT